MDQTIAKLTPQLTPLGASSLRDGLDFLRAKSWASQGDYSRAIQLLEPLSMIRRDTHEAFAEVAPASQIGIVLADCFGATGQWDRAAAAYERVAAMQPERAEVRLLAAGAWMKASQPAKAAEQYRLAMAAGTPSPALWTNIAQTMYQEQIRIPKPDRNWKEFQHALANIPATGPNAWPRTLLEADFEAARDQPDRALAILRDAEKNLPHLEPFLPTLVIAYEQWGWPADADRALARLEQLDGPSARVALTRSELLARRKQDAEAEKVVRAAIKSLPPGEQGGLKHRLAQLQIAKGQLTEAPDHAARVGRAKPVRYGNHRGAGGIGRGGERFCRGAAMGSAVEGN